MLFISIPKYRNFNYSVAFFFNDGKIPDFAAFFYHINHHYSLILNQLAIGIYCYRFVKKKLKIPGFCEQVLNLR